MVPLLPPINCVEDSWGWLLHATSAQLAARLTSEYVVVVVVVVVTGVGRRDMATARRFSSSKGNLVKKEPQGVTRQSRTHD
jgi:hypothetical protein